MVGQGIAVNGATILATVLLIVGVAWLLNMNRIAEHPQPLAESFQAKPSIADPARTTATVVKCPPTAPVLVAEQPENAETPGERQTRILSRMAEILEGFPVLPPTTEEELARLLASLLGDELGIKPADFPWIVEHFTDELVGLGDEASLSNRQTVEDVFAIRLFLGLVYQNLDNPGFAALLGSEIPIALSGGVLDLFEVLPEDVRMLLAQAMLEDRMLRGAWASAYLERLLALTPMPKSIELLLDAYSQDVDGAMFVAGLHKSRSIESLQNNVDVIAVAVRERLLELGKPEYAVTLFEGSPSQEEKVGILKAVTQLKDPELVMEMARLNEKRGLAGAPIDEMDFRYSLMTMASDGSFNARGVCEQLREQPDELHPMLLSALMGESDTWVPRYMLGLPDPRIPEDLPRHQFSERTEALAWHRLANLGPGERVHDDELEKLRQSLSSNGDDDATSIRFRAWADLGLDAASEERREAITRELTRIAESGVYPNATRDCAREQLQRLEEPATGE